MTTKMIDLKQQLVNTPLLMTPEMAQSFAALDPESFFIEDHSMTESDGMNFFIAGYGDQKLYRVENEVAIIPIQGSLLHRVNWSGYGITGYGYIKSAFDMALADPDVKGIAFDVRSGGGEVNGAFELAEHIYKHRSSKPSMAILDTTAYSAAYLLASAAGSMSIPKTGGAGSIGVVTMHVDYSEAMESMGVNITFIHAGKHKVDGNPYMKLPEKVRDRIQAKVDASYDLFVDAVSTHRGLSTENVKGTEAQTFSADEALDLSLVDAIASPEEAMASFVAELNGKSKRKETDMSTSNASKADQSVQDADTKDLFTQEQMDAACKQAALDERKRYAVVTQGEHFAGRQELGNEMLANTDLSADQINQMLKVAPKVEAKTEEDQGGADHFAEAMDQDSHPEVGADADASVDSEQSEVAGILADAGISAKAK